MTRPALWLLLVLLSCGRVVGEEALPRFGPEVLPILRAHCLKCHGKDQRKGGLSLRTPGAMLEGGDSGPAIVKGKVDESLLVEQIESGAMPPGKAAKLTAAEAATLKAWIAAGAPDDGLASANDPDDAPAHWAFRPPTRPDVPRSGHAAGFQNPIDAFLLDRLEASGLSYSAEAGRRTLIRRATFDLWGLPPTRKEIDDFLADTRDDAFERVVDRLLASPRYGERWGRHWLDLAGYADSEGILSADYERSSAWRYRDWVIAAFNADMPYDRFLREQIAGDELAEYWTAYKTDATLEPRVVDALVATGYLRCAGDTSRPDFVTIKDAPGYYYQTLDDTVKIVATSILGLTLHCAKCHTHKYDPITQAEYYGIQAVFMGGYRPAQWVPQVERKRLEATETQETRAREHNAAIDATIARRQKAIAGLTAGFADRWLQRRLAELPDSVREEVRTAVDTPAGKRNPTQQALAARHAASLRPDPKALRSLIARESPRDRDLVANLEALNAAEQRRRMVFPEIRAFYDLPGEPKTPILKRGDYLHPGPEVAPGALPAVAAPEPFRWTPPKKGALTTGRRKAFALWLTQPGHPLTARVLVNRLWLHHFGEGIVATADNFGVQGSPPSHPELLDWLAAELVARGWSIKAMHRQIMTSAAYRQSSRNDPEHHTRGRESDPDDRMLWRQRLRRLDAEALRDAVLAVAGTMNPAMGGPPVPMIRQPDGEIVTPDGPAGLRRSIFLQVRRSAPLTFLQVFDQPVMETNCTRRMTSTVSSQALNLLNSEFLVRQSEAFAARVLREDPRDPTGHAVRLAFSRPATDREQSAFRVYLAEQTVERGRGFQAALADLCHMILCSNEFAYID